MSVAPVSDIRCRDGSSPPTCFGGALNPSLRGMRRSSSARSLPARLASEHRHASRLELLRVRLVLAAREHIDLIRHDHIDEANECQDLPPLCIQQSTGNSATPEVDIVLRLLRDFQVDEDVANL